MLTVDGGRLMIRLVDGSAAGELAEIQQLTGDLSSGGTLSGQISGSVTMQGELGEAHVMSGSLAALSSMSGGLTIIGQRDTLPYDGSYEITPLAGADQILATSGRRLDDDVTVLEIPYFETTNESGGYTVTIG